MNSWVGILLLVLLLAGNAFFVAAEFAVISARRSQIEPLAESGRRSAKTALWAMEHATLMLATTQLGITVCSLLILNVSEPAIHNLLAVPLHAMSIPGAATDTIAFIITLALVTFLHVVFGEMVPKNLSFSTPDRAALMFAPPLAGIARVLRPVITALNATANGAVRLFGVQPRSEAASTFTLDEVATIVNRSKREGVLADQTGALTAAFEFAAKRAGSLALSVDRLVSLSDDATPADVERAVARFGFSRYVIMDARGEPAGYVHLKDVIDLDLVSADAPGAAAPNAYESAVPAERIRRLISVLDDTDLEDALAQMRAAGAHLARVFDARGATTGVLFLEDIIEELVGEVEDATTRA